MHDVATTLAVQDRALLNGSHAACAPMHHVMSPRITKLPTQDILTSGLRFALRVPGKTRLPQRVRV